MVISDLDRVKHGVHLLDKRCVGWRSRMDLVTLDVASEKQCPLGQLFGDYGSGLTKLGIGDAGSDYGFAPQHEVLLDHQAWLSACTSLTRIWVAIVTGLRTVSGSA